MPIFEQDLSYEDMKKAVNTFKCTRCGGLLVIAWSAQKNSYMLKCGPTPEHEGIVPYGRDNQALMWAHLLHGKELPLETTALQKLNPDQMLARVNQARFPKDLTPSDCQLIATIAIEYGLDPLFGELMLYQGRPYITIDARRRKAQETGRLDGISSRPANKAERKDRGTPDGDYLFIAEVWVKGAAHPFIGTGRVYEAETHGDSHLPVVKDPGAQAEKRAEAQALRRAFHIPLPSVEEIIEGEFTPISEDRAPGKSETTTKTTNGYNASPKTGPTATEAQKKKIWADAQKMGYQNTEIHTIIKNLWQVTSVNDLSVAQASKLIDMIKRGEEVPGTLSETGGK